MNFLDGYISQIGTNQIWFYYPTDSIIRDPIKRRPL